MAICRLWVCMLLLSSVWTAPSPTSDEEDIGAKEGDVLIGRPGTDAHRSGKTTEERSYVVIESDGQTLKTIPIGHSYDIQEDISSEDDDKSGPSFEHGGDSESHTSRRKRKVNGPLWPGGQVPFSFNKTPGKTWPDQASVENKVRSGVRRIERRTCIRFQEVDEGTFKGERVVVSNGNVCRSTIGYNDNSTTTLTLMERSKHRSCAEVGIIVHEFLHALGLLHEHVRVDRNEYLEVNIRNVVGARRKEYKVDPGSYNVAPYDLGSVMHYGLRTFAVSSTVRTMTLRTPALDFLPGQKDGMSFYDAMTLNIIYDCAGNCTIDCVNDGYPFMNSEGQCVCMCPDLFTGQYCQEVITSPGCGGVFQLRYTGDAVRIAANTTAVKDSRTCVWHVKGPDILRIHFNFFEIKLNPSAMCDHSLEVRFNLIAQPGPRLCGMKLPGDLSTKDDFGIHSTLLVFRESSNMAFGGGFDLSVIASEVDDSCLSNPCYGGATCHNNRQLNTFLCDCAYGFKGPLCDEWDTDGSMTCDFEDSLGFLENLLNDDFDWNRKTGSTATKGTGPSGGFESATYAYCEASFPIQEGDVALLGSPYLSLHSGRCISFFLHMYGTDTDMGHLEVLLQEEDTGQPLHMLFSNNTNQNDVWRQLNFSVPISASYARLVFKYTRNGAKGDVAIDNVMTYPGMCKEEESHKHIDICACDFENVTNPLCDCLAQSTKGQFNWTHLVNDSSPSTNTGPDIAANRFGYLYYETSLGTRQGDKVVLETTASLYPGDMCLRFSYNMYGDTMGVLSVTALANGEEVSLWSKDADLGNNWFIGKVNIPPGTTKVYIEASKGDSYRSDIAIDNVKLKTGRCVFEPCDKRPCRHSPEDGCSNALAPSVTGFSCLCPSYLTGDLCDRVDFGSSNDIVTDFEMDGLNPLGIFAQRDDDDFNWYIKKGPTATYYVKTGPSSSHEGQFYAYCEGSSPNPANARAVLVSELIPGGSDYCFDFHYHMYGRSMGSLGILLQLDDKDSPTVQWYKQEQQSSSKDDWRHAQVNVASQSASFQVLVKCTLGPSDSLTDIAIDQVILKKGQCTK